jgi:transposase
MGWRRGQAYSLDLRSRVLSAVDEGMDVGDAAELFKVDRSYIYKALIRRRLTGETTARAALPHGAETGALSRGDPRAGCCGARRDAR